MKKRNCNKAIALVLGLSLTAALMGCGQKDEQSVAPETTGSTAGAESSASESEAAGKEEENPIKWSGTISVAPYMWGPVENDVVTPLIEEKLLEYGYDVTLENVYLENAQYSELLNLRLASGDAPDIFYAVDANTYAEYCRQGLIATWDEEFFREHAPDVAAFIDAGEPDGDNAEFAGQFWEMSKYEDKMAIIPLYGRNSGSLMNVIYNKQWMEKLNAEVPETLDEFVELMYRFKNEDPDGNGKDDTYGFSTSMLNIIFGAYGSFPGFLHMDGEDYGHWYDVDGKLVAADVMDGNEEALKLIKQLYDDGIIDPEFVTGENQGGYWALSHSFMNGRIGVTHTARFGHYQPALFDKDGNQVGSEGTCLTEFKAIQGQDADVIVGPWLKGPNGDIGGFLRSTISLTGGVLYNASLNEDPEKLAAIFEIMNIFSTDDEIALLEIYGVEGEHYTFAEEGYTIRNSEAVPDAVAMNSLGMYALRSLYGPEQPFNYTIFTVGDTSPAKSYEINLKAQYEGLANSVGYISKVWSTLPSTGEYSGELKTYRDETWLNIIQGKVELDWDGFVEEWNKRGGQVLTEEANEWYQEHK